VPRPLDAAELLAELAYAAENARAALDVAEATAGLAAAVEGASPEVRVTSPGDARARHLRELAQAVRALEPFALLDGGPVVAALVARTRLAYAEAEAGDVEALRRAARHLDALAVLVADRRRALVGPT